MDDREILSLFFARSDRAILETEKKYGALICSIAQGILYNAADAEECTNDTLLRAWNAIPPAQPDPLPPYLIRIARNLCLDRLRRAKAFKRGEPAVALEELGEIAAAMPDNANSEEIKNCINAFLYRQKPVNRSIFVRRYWYLNSIGEIATFTGKSEMSVHAALSRMRKALKRQLEREGISL